MNGICGLYSYIILPGVGLGAGFHGVFFSLVYNNVKVGVLGNIHKKFPSKPLYCCKMTIVGHLWLLIPSLHLGMFFFVENMMVYVGNYGFCSDL